jgi:hypothetical protein
VPDLPLILQLQHDAADPSVSVATLLRKAKMAAVKLNVPDIMEWVGHELDGYSDVKAEDLPKYRQLEGHPKAWNPYHGWQPIHIVDPETYEIFANAPLGQAIGALEEMFKEHSNGIFSMAYDVRRRTALLEMMDYPTDVHIELSYGQGKHVVDSVRNIVLNWALELEKKGVLGEEYSFSASEKTQAQPVSQQFFAHNIGFVGSAHSGAQVSTNQTVNQGVNVGELMNLLAQAGSVVRLLPEGVRQEAEHQLDEVEKEASAVTTNVPKLRSLLQSLRTTCEGAAGNVVAAGILSLIDKVI